MADKTFTVAGTSVLNGVMKVRFANDLKGRIKVLTKNDHCDVQLIELAEAQTKINAVLALRASADFASVEQQAVFDRYIAKNDPKLAVEIGIVLPGAADAAERAVESGAEQGVEEFTAL